MSALFQFFLFLLTLNNLALLGMGRLRTLINLVTAQGILLGGLLLIHDHALLAVAVLLIKGGLLPWLLHRTRRQIGADPHIKPRLGFGLAVLTGLACLVFSLWLEGRLPMTPGLFPPLLLPAGLTTLFCGLLLVVGRATALSQVMGYLVAENGAPVRRTAHAAAGQYHRLPRPALAHGRAAHGPFRQTGCRRERRPASAGLGRSAGA